MCKPEKSKLFEAVAPVWAVWTGPIFPIVEVITEQPEPEDDEEFDEIEILRTERAPTPEPLESELIEYDEDAFESEGLCLCDNCIEVAAREDQYGVDAVDAVDELMINSFDNDDGSIEILRDSEKEEEDGDTTIDAPNVDEFIVALIDRGTQTDDLQFLTPPPPSRSHTLNQIDRELTFEELARLPPRAPRARRTFPRRHTVTAHPRQLNFEFNPAVHQPEGSDFDFIINRRH